jgi:ribosome-binding protein aMBF1 (putative translation factor)
MAVVTYGNLVRDARLARGMSQGALLKRLVEIFGRNAISLSTIKRTEGGAGTPEERTKKQIARVLPEAR